MTHERAETMEAVAGRELDAKVAELVVGWERVSLIENTLNVKFFTDPKNEKMYNAGEHFDYLVRPNRMKEGDGQVLVREQIGELRIGGDQDLPYFSTSIADAWRVVEKMFQLGFRARIETCKPVGIYWYCLFIDESDESSDEYVIYTGEGATAPHAICLAALAAVQSKGGA